MKAVQNSEGSSLSLYKVRLVPSKPTLVHLGPQSTQKPWLLPSVKAATSGRTWKAEMQSVHPSEVCTSWHSSLWCLCNQFCFKGKWQVAKLIYDSKVKINKRYSENGAFPLLSPGWKSFPRKQMKCLLSQERSQAGEISYVSWLLCLRCHSIMHPKVLGALTFQTEVPHL